MTPELVVAIIAFLAALTALVKQITDVLKLKAQRQETKEARDADSLSMHDELLKHSMLITQLKDNQALHATVMDDLRDTTQLLNTNVAKLGVVVDGLAEAIKELKR